MKSIIEKCVKSILALTMVFTSLIVGNLSTTVNASEEGYPVNEYDAKYGSSIIVDRWDGDHEVALPSFPAATEFTFTADVEIESSENDQESVALIFGANENGKNFANVHGQGQHFAQAWGYSAGNWGDVNHLYLGSAKGQINLSEKFRMSLNVTLEGGKYKLTYSLSSLDAQGNIAHTYAVDGDLTNYTGGSFGLMTHHTKATFSNIQLNYKDGNSTKTVTYGTYQKTSDGFTVNGVNGDAHLLMSDPDVVATDFVYETDVDLIAGPSVALTFGIEDPNNIGASWVGANFNFNDYGGNGQIRVFQVKNGDPTICNATEDARGNKVSQVIQKNKTIHLKLVVTKEGQVTFTVKNKDDDEAIVASGSFADKGLTYNPGKLGILCFDSSAKFSNTTIQLGNKFELSNSNDFVKVNTDEFSVNEENDTVTLGKVDGDNFSMFALPVNTNAFTMEADVKFTTDGNKSAGLMFGTSSATTPGSRWYAANVDTSRANNSDCFRMFGDGRELTTDKDGSKGNIDLDAPLHLKLVMDENGNYTYTFGNVTGPTKSMSGTIPNWNGGYLGLLTHKSGAEFSNIHIINNYTVKTVTTTPLVNDGKWKTNLTNLSYDVGTWTIDENGLTSNAKGIGDSFLLTESTGSNFVYSTTLTFKENVGAAGLVFRSENDLVEKEAYAVNVSPTNGDKAEVKFWRWYRNDALQLIDTKQIDKAASYELKVVAYDTWILYYVNDVLVASLGDYNLQWGNLGQPTAIKSGKFGLVNWNGYVTYQNTYFKEFTSDFNPVLSDIEVTSSTGTVEHKAIFTPEEPTMIQFVKNDATTVNVTGTSTYGSTIVVKDSEGIVYPNGTNIPVKEGKNIITVESTDSFEDGTTAKATYHVDVHRLQKDEVYYNEAYRGQYHYSVKEGWANDPNGMVYDAENKVYHLFYQFMDSVDHGPMHWAHATSKDLIRWEEKPITFYPDANGTMFSGCVVNDTENTSGLFAGAGSTNFVAIITEDGNGQRLKLATSTDGDNWTKHDTIVADWTDDPVNSAAFRDPKVFRWEGKWFMVIAGGRLRIYSSNDLKTWECESYYDGTAGSSGFIETECPDLYPLIADDGTLKWVLSEGGRFYRVGDFTNVNTASGKWEFIEDSQYANSKPDGRGYEEMNFGADSYAAMTYYIQDFGGITEGRTPNIPEIIEINWMNTWAGGPFCLTVGHTLGQAFNGSFNLNLSLGLVKQGDKYVLTQTPIQKTTSGLVHGGYEELRSETPIVDTDGFKTVTSNNNILGDLVDDTYEIVATFSPGTATKVGFSLREGNNQKTVVLYDLGTKEISIDRSNSSSYYTSGYYTEKMSQFVEENSDGTIDFHIYVDKSSVEVFMEGYTVAGAAQIFPDPSSLGASLIVEGGEASVDLKVYDMKSIWKKTPVTKPISMITTVNEFNCLDINETLELSANVLPIDLSQAINWEVVDGEGVISLTTNNNKATVTALKDGVATIKATSVLDETMYKKFTVKVHNNTVNTNEFENSLGDASNFVDTNNVLTITDPKQNSTYMSKENVPTDFVLDADLSYTNGMVNVFFSSDVANPIASKAYAIQFDNARNVVRLFRFDIDGDTALGALPANKAVNNGDFFHVTIEKSGKTIKVYVNDELCLTHTYSDVVDYFNNPAKVGVGVWDGSVKVKNFVVNTRNIEKLSGDDYTNSSYATYEKLVDKVASVEASELAALLNEIEKAEAALVNVASLKEVIARVCDTDTDLYTEESANAFILAYNRACAAVVNGTVESVEAAEKALVDAYDALEEKATESVPGGETGDSDSSDEGTTGGSTGGLTGGSTGGTNTGDSTNVAGLLAMMLLSLGVILLGKRKKA